VFKWHEKEGIMEWQRHLDITFNERFELERFPFDRQFLSMQLILRQQYLIRTTPFPIPGCLIHTKDQAAFYRLMPNINGWKAFPAWVVYPSSASRDMKISLRLHRESGYYWNGSTPASIKIPLPTSVFYITTLCSTRL
jgi:hypothetical protein